MKKAKLFMMLALLVMGVSNVFAQNVTIRPTNGNMICALTNTTGSTNQLGFRIGAFGTWKHNQLSLTMTGSNDKDLTEDGQLATHANHFITGDKCTFNPSLANTNDAKKYIVADWGGTDLNTGYITISLPKGYRFTGYTFMVSHDVSMFGQNNTSSNNGFDLTTNTNVYMSETDNTFNPNINTITLAGNSSDVKTLTRKGDDMGNVLYFKTYARNSGFYAVTFRYIELTFTADANASVDVIPSAQQTSGTSMMEIPFNTGKVDFGNITKGEYMQTERISYQYQSVTDMPANMLLYEKESVKDGTGFDGTSGKVAYQKSGSITTSGEYFKFTADNKEEGADRQIYYLETPVSAKMKNDKETPVQFRIVGATLNYTSDVSSAKSFYITYVASNGTKYYMDRNGTFTTTPTTWSIDDDGYISTGSDYLYVNGGYAGYINNKRNAHIFSIDNSGIKCISGSYYNGLYLKVIDYSEYGYSIDGYFTSSNYANATVESISSGDSEDAATLYVYDKEGANPQEITVDGSGSVELKGFNNDAIKFAVKNGDAVYMNFVLIVQALSPYIDQMNIVVNDVDNGKDLHFKQTFNSDDFSVGGDAFDFYLPTGCEDDDITITFEDLFSKYGDETYNHIANDSPGNSRYNYVKSNHYNVLGDNIYSQAGKAEAASSTTETERLSATNGMIRTQVGTVGNVAFRFNNADVLSTQSGYFTEYPFTLANYEAQTNPGKGEFVEAEFKGIKDGDKNTFYVFTTDETRYNIAPTTATQHRFYAFYEMKVNIHLADYSPTVQFEKIYDKTFYVKDGNEVGYTEKDPQPMYGAIVTALIPDINKPGLASPKSINDAINDAIENAESGSDVPESLKQILYVDMHQLGGTFETSDLTFETFKNSLAKNVLMYLPKNTTSTLSNFATLTDAGYRAAQDIIVTDKAPFFAPYDIHIPIENAAKYERGITWPQNGAVAQATVVLPFTIDIDEDGLHTNPDKTTFNLYHMQPKQSISMGDGEYKPDFNYDYGIGYFTNIGEDFFDQVGDVRVAKANTPYMVFVNSGTTDKKSFDVVSNGALVKATTNNGVFTGESSIAEGFDGSDNDKYNFTSKGTFTGEIKENARENAKVFYFAGGYFLNSTTLKKGLSLYIYPFRTYYAYTGSAPAKVQKFRAVFGENEDNNTTGISEVQKNADFAAIPGNGCITLMAKVDKNIIIHAINGQTVEKCSLRAGDTRTVSLAAGVYVINGVKMIVK